MDLDLDGRDSTTALLTTLTSPLTGFSHRQALAPDGDVIVPDELVSTFRVPACGVCGGLLKPDLVFFGDNVPGPVRDTAFDRLREADAVLVAGSSLEVRGSDPSLVNSVLK